MNPFKDLITAAQDSEIMGLFSLGCWLRDSIDELQAGALISAISADLRVEGMPVFHLVTSKVANSLMTLEVKQLGKSEIIQTIEVLAAPSGFQLLKREPEQANLI